jgi:hypothetical protein
MQESYGEGLATHTGPKSCVGVRKGAGEALTGVRAGRVFGRERCLRSADAVRGGGRPYPTRRYREAWRGSARSQTPGMYGYTSCENRERRGSPAGGAAGRVGKSQDARR